MDDNEAKKLRDQIDENLKLRQEDGYRLTVQRLRENMNNTSKPFDHND